MLAATTADPAIDAEIATVRCALDRSLDEKWDHFRTDFRDLWGQFQTECIESSHKLVVAEKAAADERYAVLKDAYDKVKAKCADMDRYNQLLQEKLDHTQAEMKSLSAVSMTIQWEKRVASKQAECERLTKQLEKQKQINTTLKRENTLLNTQLEQWGDAKEAETRAAAVETEATDAVTKQMSTDASSLDTTADASVEAPPLTELSKAETDTGVMTIKTNTESTANAESPEASQANDPPVECVVDATTPVSSDTSTEPRGETTPQLSIPSNVAQETEGACTVPEEVVAQEMASTTEAELALPSTSADAVDTPEATLPIEAAEEHETTTLTVVNEPANEVSLASSVPVPPVPTLTYTLKKLKRKKTDTEKTPFLLGSDDVLYTWTEGDVPGAAVGTKTARGYKFTKR